MRRRSRVLARSSIIADRVDVDDLRSSGQEGVMATVGKILESERILMEQDGLEAVRKGGQTEG